jgi:hypothetical protein
VLAEYVGTYELKLQNAPIATQQDVLMPFRIDENVLYTAKPRNNDGSAVCRAGSLGDNRKHFLTVRQYP